MLFGIAEATCADNVVQRMRAALTEGRNVILRQMSLAPSPTVSTAMVLCCLDHQPLRLRKVIAWGVHFVRTAFMGADGMRFRMCVFPASNAGPILLRILASPCCGACKAPPRIGCIPGSNPRAILGRIGACLCPIVATDMFSIGGDPGGLVRLEVRAIGKFPTLGTRLFASMTFFSGKAGLWWHRASSQGKALRVVRRGNLLRQAFGQLFPSHVVPGIYQT